MRVKVVAYIPHSEFAALPEKDRKKGEPGNLIDVSDALAEVWLKNNWAIAVKQPSIVMPPSIVESVSPLEQAILEHGGVARIAAELEPQQEPPLDESDKSEEESTEDESEDETKDMADSIEFAVINGAPERVLSRRGRRRKKLNTWKP